MNILREALKELKTLEEELNEEINPKDSQAHDIVLKYEIKNSDYVDDDGTTTFEIDVEKDDALKELNYYFDEEDVRLALEEDNTDLSDWDEERINDYIELHFDKLVERHLQDFKENHAFESWRAAEEYFIYGTGPDPDEYDDGPDY